MIESEFPEHVYVENEWYDGPHAGIADVFGKPHRFKSVLDEKEDQIVAFFPVWPIGKEEFDLEVEQWRIFAEWDALREAGKVDTETHPGRHRTIADSNRIGTLRGFLPLGLYDAHPMSVTFHHWSACTDGHPTNLNCRCPSTPHSQCSGWTA